MPGHTSRGTRTNSQASTQYPNNSRAQCCRPWARSGLGPRASLSIASDRTMMRTYESSGPPTSRADESWQGAGSVAVGIWQIKKNGLPMRRLDRRAGEAYQPVAYIATPNGAVKDANDRSPVETRR